MSAFVEAVRRFRALRSVGPEAESEKDREFISGAQWAPEQALDALRTQAQTNSAQINRVLAQADIDKMKAQIAAVAWLFKDNEGNYTFTHGMWKDLHRENRQKYTPDAVAHRDEALRRRTVCRLEGRHKEADHWLAQQRFLENLFGLECVA